MKNFFYRACMLSAIVLTLGSCQKKVDAEIIRLYANAHELYANEKFSDAAALLNGVNKFPPALTLRAKAEYFIGDLDLAEKSCRKAIKYRPAAFEAKFYLAKILWEKGEDTNAKKAAEELMADNPYDVRLLRFAAIMALEKGDAAEASALLDRAAELSADSAVVLLDRARLRWISGNGPDALEDLSRARAMLPWDTPLARSINQLEKRIVETLR
jgi:tetratricopeptide (TPR) repeat protein